MYGPSLNILERRADYSVYSSAVPQSSSAFHVPVEECKNITIRAQEESNR